MKFLTFLASKFVAGETPDKAIKAVQKLNSRRISATLDILGENVTNEEQARNTVKQYLELLDMIHESKVDSHISIKLTQMGLDIGKEFCLENIMPIIKKVEEYKTFVRIDMEGSDYTDATLDILYELRRNYECVGIVLQAMLLRTDKDVEKTIQENTKVRLCKGAYKEPADIAYNSMDDIVLSYQQLAEKLLLNGNFPALASHDDKTIDHVLNFVKEKNICPSKFEFQFLYGLRQKLWDKLVNEGYNVRIYVPFGTHWFPYSYRRLREKKENIFFVLKNMFR